MELNSLKNIITFGYVKFKRMQIKVKETRPYNKSLSISFDGTKATETSMLVEVRVAEGMLVLVECKPEEALLFEQGNEVYKGQINHYSFEFGLVNGLGKYLIPILISKTEKIEVGDWVLHWDNMILEKAIDQQLADHYDSHKDDYSKLLALSEHFSPQQLQMIVVSKLKDEGKILVECENKMVCPTRDGKHLFDSCSGNWYCSRNCSVNESIVVIKLNSSNHITVHKFEEKTNTREEIINECIDKVRSLIKDNCDDHTPYRGACVTCGKHDNPDILPDPEEVIRALKELI